MRIDALSSEKDRTGRYRVTLDDGSVLRLYRQTVEDFGIYTGMELSREEYNALVEAAGQMSAKMRAVRIVSASSVSKKDLQQRLIRKGEDPQQAKNAVEWMCQLDLVDDRKTAQQVVQRCISKGYGINRARQALYEKQIPKNLWDEALSEYPDQADAIIKYLQDHLDENSDRKAVQKAIEALIRRGHTYPQIKRCLGSISCNSEDFPEE